MENDFVDWNCGDLIIEEFEIDSKSVGCGFNYKVKCGTVMNNGYQLLRIMIVDTREHAIYRQSINVEWIPIGKKKWFAEVQFIIICQSIQESKTNTLKTLRKLPLKDLLKVLT